MAKKKCEVAVYHLLDTQLLIDNQEALKAALCYQQHPDDFQMIINPVSGWIRLWQPDAMHSAAPVPNLPQSSEDALDAAREYFSEANKIMKNKKGKLSRAGIPPLFNMKLQHVYTNPVLSRHSGAVDHWLTRFYITVDAGYKNKTEYVQVIGAGIDIRIGSGGKLISLSYHWRPYIQKQRKSISARFVEEIMAGLPEFQKALESHHAGGGSDHHHGKTAEHPEQEVATEALSLPDQLDHLFENGFSIRYKFADEYDPTSSLAPFLVLIEGHHMAYAPLCEHSMVAQILYDGNNLPLTLYAQVSGGSGSFDYEWAYWQLHRLEDGIQTAGSAASATIPAGVYNVALHVTDRKTGQSVQTQIMTYGNWSTTNQNLV